MEHVARLKIVYANENLEVLTNLRGDGKWTRCFAVSNIKLPSDGYIGFSAATGQVSDEHDLIFVTTQEIPQEDAASAIDVTHAKSFRQASMRNSGGDALNDAYSWISIFVVACGIAVIAYFYVRISKSRMKRF